MKNHRVYYLIGGITIQVESDLSITENTFHPKLRPFQVNGPGKDTVFISHHFTLPDLEEINLGKRLYSSPPWSIYKKGDSWIYFEISQADRENDAHKIAIFNNDHTRGQIFYYDDTQFRKGNFTSLTLFASDQILVGRLLADREGCYLHACGAILDGKGLLFVGHSGAGKSTTSLMLKEQGAELLCDDRVIVRKHPDGFRIYGNWNHGDVSDISPSAASLHAIFFLEQSRENTITPLSDKKAAIKDLLACLVKPLETADWWEKELSVLAQIVQTVPCYRMQFDKSGTIVDKIKAV